MSDSMEFVTNDPLETEAVAARFAAHLRAGDRVALRADLGGGKTTFTRGLVRGLDHPDPREVASPTYAVHHRYEGGRLPVDHLDLYRLDGDPLAWDRQGVLDPLRAADGVVVVEWGERLDEGGAAPPAFTCVVTLRVLTEESRRIRVAFADPDRAARFRRAESG